MWGLLRPGIERVSPCTVGRFFTPEPPGTPAFFFFFYFNSEKGGLTVKAKKPIIGKHGKTNYEDWNHNNNILAKLFYFFLPSLYSLNLAECSGYIPSFLVEFLLYSIWTYINFLSGFTRGSDGKESACNGDLASVPGLGGSLGGGHGGPLQLLLPGESPWTEEPVGLQSQVSKCQTWMSD